jgi:hypothetical protein
MIHVKSSVATVLTVVAWTSAAMAQDPGAAPAPAPAPAPVATVDATATATMPTPTVPVDEAAPANPDLGEPGALVIDQVSGFRGRVGGGVGFYGPVGVAYNSFEGATGQQLLIQNGQIAGATSSETTIRSWSIWLAPSLDYFIVPNVSIGGLFAVDTTFGSAESKITTTRGVTPTVSTSESDLPSVTSFTLMPRVGYFFRINDRLSFWPRVGFGYFSGTNAAVQTDIDPTTQRATTYTRSTNISSLLVQVDVGIIYQITDNVFFRVAPAVTFSSNGSSTVKYKNAPAASNLRDAEGNGSAFQFEISSGFGANFSL